MPAHRTWTDQQLTVAVAESITMAAVYRRLGLKPGGGTHEHLRGHVRRLGLDTSHFRGQGWGKGQRHSPEDLTANLMPLLRRGVLIKNLLRRLLASGLKERKCERCGLTEWLGKPAPVQVDHRDGDHLNNELANLCILCANCHMQTETWGFKNGRRRPTQALVA